jgi:hypothetical protein
LKIFIKPTGQPNPKDLAENKRFQGFLKEILEIDNRANLRFARNLRDFNTLVLKSRFWVISEISDEISEQIIKHVIIFLKKMIGIEGWAYFNTLVLKYDVFGFLENDRPVGRSFSRNSRFEESRVLLCFGPILG